MQLAVPAVTVGACRGWPNSCDVRDAYVLAYPCRPPVIGAVVNFASRQRNSQTSGPLKLSEPGPRRDN